MFDENDKRELLSIARGAIDAALQGRKFGLHQEPQSLLQHSGAFVTLRIDHELRGCIGYIETEKPLAEVIAEVAMKSAFEDPRFAPLTREEFKHTTIEISVLTPLRRIHSIEEIEIGKHGLVISLGARRGLLLPQVAVEHHLDRKSFVEATARKAGLLPSMWSMSDAELFVFEAEVLHEESVGV